LYANARQSAAKGAHRDQSLPDTVRQRQEARCAFFDPPLRLIAQRAVRVWSNRERLDQLPTEHVYLCSYSDLISAIEIDGRQISSNGCADSSFL
jgi:hypothetical protein